jgi:hypothetical protein
MKRLEVRPPGNIENDWKWNSKKRRLENIDLGVAIQVFNAFDPISHKTEYEGIAIESRRCELHIVVNHHDELGFVFHRRLSVIPPEDSSKEFKVNPKAVLSVLRGNVGIEQYEACHGLAASPGEEVREELGLAIEEKIPIGFVKDSPPLGGIAHELFAVKVGSTPSNEKPESNEQIVDVKFFPPEEVKNIETICGLTQAALWRFRSWGLAQSKDTFWNKIASRL